MFDPASVTIRGPLRAHAEGFAADLLAQGYAQATAKHLLFLTAHLGRWLEAERLALPDLTEGRVDAFFRHRRQEGYSGYRTRRALEPLLRYLRGLGVVDTPMPQVDDSPIGKFVQEYRTYLRVERGLADSTLHARTVFAKEFARSERPRLDWHRLTARDITSYIRRRCRRVSVPTCKNTVTELRSLLRFLYVQGRTPHDLTSSVPAVAGWRLSGLPPALAPGQVSALLRSFDGSPLGLRDAAIVRLLLRLGLRAAEVAALDLDDVDWRSARLTVRGKGRRDTRLPLPHDVGRALAAYLQRGRPRTSTRGLFVRSHAPHTRIRPGAVSHLA